MLSTEVVLIRTDLLLGTSKNASTLTIAFLIKFKAVVLPVEGRAINTV